MNPHVLRAVLAASINTDQCQPFSDVFERCGVTIGQNYLTGEVEVVAEYREQSGSVPVLVKECICSPKDLHDEPERFIGKYLDLFVKEVADVAKKVKEDKPKKLEGQLQ